MYVKYHFYLPRSVGNRHSVHQPVGLLVHPVDVHLGPERLDEVDGMNSLDLGIHVLLR